MFVNVPWYPGATKHLLIQSIYNNTLAILQLGATIHFAISNSGEILETHYKLVKSSY